MPDRFLASYLTSKLYNYVQDGMGYELFKQPHEEMCNFFEEMLPPPPDQMPTAKQKYGMLLAPRETLKTSIAQGAVEYFCRKFKHLYNYDARVILVRANREAAKQVLNAVREDFSGKNQVLRRAFGNLEVDSPLWTTEAITFNDRATNYREPSISTAGLDVSKTGDHVDLILIDDIANETNYMSDKTMLQARRYIQTMMPILNSWGSMIVVGTRWSHLDPYGWIIEQDEKNLSEIGEELWNKRIWGAWREDEGHEGELFYPDYLTEEKLEQKRRSMESKLFTAFYLNKVIPDDSQVFMPNQIRYYDGYYIPRGDDYAQIEFTSEYMQGERLNVWTAIHVDPATTITEASNFTGINVVCTDEMGRRWVEKSWKGKEVPSAIILRLVENSLTYLPNTISIDVLGQQVLWVDLLRRALDEAGLKDVTITQYKGKDGKVGTGPLSKRKRIEAMEPLFRDDLIRFKTGRCGSTVGELKTYTGVTPSNHYDALDSLSHTMHVSHTPIENYYQQEREDMEYLEEFGEKVVKGRHWTKGTKYRQVAI